MTIYDEIIHKVEGSGEFSEREVNIIKDNLKANKTLQCTMLREKFLEESRYQYFIKKAIPHNVSFDTPINSAIFCDFYALYSLNYFNINHFDVCLIDTNNINYKEYSRYGIELKDNDFELKVFIENYILLCREVLSPKGTFVVTCNTENLYMLYNLCVELLGEQNYIGTFSWEGIDNKNKYLNDNNQYSLIFTKNKHGYKYNKIASRLESAESTYTNNYKFKNKYRQAVDVYAELFTFFENNINVLDVFGDSAMLPLSLNILNKKDSGSRSFTSLICNNERNSYMNKLKDNLDDIVFYDMGYTKDLNKYLNYECPNFVYHEDYEYHLKFKTSERLNNEKFNISENNDLLFIVIYDTSNLEPLKKLVDDCEKNIVIYPSNPYIKKELNKETLLKKHILNKIK